jgi:hypothetical protein
VSTGEIVAFTDDDVRPHRSWLRSIGTRFVLEPEISCVSGLVVPDELETKTQVWFEESGCGLDRNLHRYRYHSVREGDTLAGVARERFLVRREEDGNSVVHWLYMLGSFGMGCNFAFRRQILSAAGGFDLALGAGTPTKGGEDIVPLVELLFAGGTLAYEPSAIISHTHRRTYEELRDQVHGYGLGFTAALTALAVRDPRHLVGYLRVALPGLRAVLGFGSSTKNAGRPLDYPVELSRLELRGMLAGPFAYLRSRRRYRSFMPSSLATRVEQRSAK